MAVAGAPKILNCIFRGNTATTEGGGVYNSNATTASIPKYIQALIVGNSAPSGGGVANSTSAPRFTNCDIVGNQANSQTGKGSAIYNDNTKASFAMVNSIVWANTGAQATALEGNLGTSTEDFCDIEDFDPQFINGDGADNVYGTS